MFRPFWGDAHFGLPPFAQWGPCIKTCPDLWLESLGTEGHLGPLFLFHGFVSTSKPPKKSWLINFRDPQNYHGLYIQYIYIYLYMFIWFFIPTSLGSVCHPLNFPKQPNLRSFFRTLRCKNGMRGRFFVKQKDDFKSTIEVIPQSLEIAEQNLWKGHVFTLTNFAKRSLKEELPGISLEYIPIGFMGLAYLREYIVDFYGKCR